MAEENMHATQTADFLAGPKTESAQETGASQAINQVARENPGKQPISKPEIIGVRNQTNQRLTIKFELDQNQFQEVTFAPLQKRSLHASQRQRGVYKELDRRGIILLEHKDQPEQSRSGEDIIGIISTLAFPYFVAGIFVSSTFPDYNLYYWAGAPLGLLAYIILTWLYTYIADRFGWITVRRGAAQSLTLLLVMAIGLGLTTATIYFFGDGPTLLQSGPSLALLTRLLQMTFIAIAALLPALLYYLFDRQQLGTLRERFERQIFNLDPMIQTLGEVQAKYGSQLDELYGRDAITSSGRLVPGTRWPILLCTVVITAGWIMTLQPIGTNFIIQTPSAMLALFFPQPALLTIGFLGTYYFALNLILRRYTRGDLQPKAYSHIAVRIFIVTISAWVIEMLIGVNNYTRALIFIIGIVPETFITAIQEIFRSNPVVAWVLPQLQEKHPLTGLEGIDLYDRSRLAEEGVANVESLAHHDLIDLMLATRIPVPRLVDWVDQAILYLHLSEDVDLAENRRQIPRTLRRLKEYGIRNATDLEKVLEQHGPSKITLTKYLDSGEPKKDINGILTSVPIEIIYTAMKDDDWLDYIRHWRKSKAVGTTNIMVKSDGSIKNE